MAAWVQYQNGDKYYGKVDHAQAREGRGLSAAVAAEGSFGASATTSARIFAQIWPILRGGDCRRDFR